MRRLSGYLSFLFMFLAAMSMGIAEWSVKLALVLGVPMLVASFLLLVVSIPDFRGHHGPLGRPNTARERYRLAGNRLYYLGEYETRHSRYGPAVHIVKVADESRSMSYVIHRIAREFPSMEILVLELDRIYAEEIDPAIRIVEAYYAAARRSLPSLDTLGGETLRALELHHARAATRLDRLFESDIRNLRDAIALGTT